MATAACAAPQSLQFDSIQGAFIQNNVLWSINLGQTLSSPVTVSSLQIIPQDMNVNQKVQITLVGTNGQAYGPYENQLTSGTEITFSNFQPIPVSTIQVVLPNGFPSGNVQAIVTVCPQSNNQPSRKLRFMFFLYLYLFRL